LEDGSGDLSHLLGLDHPVVVDVKQAEGPGELLLLTAIGDNVQGEHVLAKVDDAVPVAVESAEDVAAEVVSTVVWEEHRVHGTELAWEKLATGTMSSEL